ncbi:MAG: type II secretion system protein [Candidatus Omnitrophica bacterium]|jgi:prepilin-type N-terminal cleavage/methylation domain-containing protein|nr:type II secretion system protein [Candidatus Omnitrophota bacterium]
MINKSAFTILELVMVLLVIGIVSAVAITQIPDLEGMRIAQAAYKIQSDIRYAQRLAMQLQRRTAILFNAAADNYSIYIENTYGASDWSVSVKAKNPLTQEDFDVQLNSVDFLGVDITLVVFNNLNYALMFDRDGVPYSIQPAPPFNATPLANPAGIVLNNNRKYIIVKQGTGSVNIQDVYP